MRVMLRSAGALALGLVLSLLVTLVPVHGQPRSLPQYLGFGRTMGGVNVPIQVGTDGKVVISAGGGGTAPSNATYITQTANSFLTSEQPLASLATGLMMSAITTGIVSTLAPTDDNLAVGSGTAWQLKALSSCSAASSALTYNTGTNAFGCNTISATPASPDTSIQFNNSGAFGGDLNLTWSPTTRLLIGPGNDTGNNYYGLALTTDDGTGGSLALISAGGSYNDIDFYAMRGTLASKSAVQATDFLGLTTYGGWNGAGFSAPIDIQAVVSSVSANTYVYATYQMNWTASDVGLSGGVQLWLNGDSGVVSLSKPGTVTADTSPGLFGGGAGDPLKVRTRTNGADADFTAKAGTFSGVIQGAGYKSSDGSTGATVTACTGFKNGLCISGT